MVGFFQSLFVQNMSLNFDEKKIISEFVESELKSSLTGFANKV